MISFRLGTRTYIHVEQDIQIGDALGRQWLSIALSILSSLLRRLSTKLTHYILFLYSAGPF